MEYYGKYQEIFDKIASMQKSTAYNTTSRWHVEDIPDVIDAYNSACQHYPRGVKLLFESKMDFSAYDIENYSAYIEQNYERAVALLKAEPDITFDQFKAVL